MYIIRLDMLRDDKKAYLADTEKLERILDNIISTSLRYMPENGTIAAAASAADKKLAVSIQDTGPGFNKEELKKAPERFYHGDKARRTGSGHTGLGLLSQNNGRRRWTAARKWISFAA